MKTLLVLTLMIASLGLMNAQEVISTAGDVNEAGGYSLSWTMGETISGTATGTSHILTQGFQQPWMTITSVETPDEMPLLVYPNPVDQWLTIEGTLSGSTIYMYDMSGKQVLSEAGTDNQVNLICSDLTPGTYLLSVILQNGTTRNFRILKNQ